MNATSRLAILGTGNIGRALATGLSSSGRMKPAELILTRRKIHLLEDLAAEGFTVQADNVDAVRCADTLIAAVEPQQLDPLLREIAPAVEPDRHLLISVVSGASIADIVGRLGKEVPVVRAMPNTAAALGRSMTCLSTNSPRQELLDRASTIFGAIGETLVIDEELMVPATALCACGIAFFLRAVRAASQAGIEIGFHPEDALTMAAQTALGAAALVKAHGKHPEREIDTVTTPRGCTIAGLNELEHRGFSSALIKGIVTSAEKASGLYKQGQ
ncbi:MAG: pyrroline-5-carboxylate reductase [Acidobacteriota bacterium]|nr:pyrroline-5-carboxylate reductase [Acidobacteriota bacterium]